MILAKVALSLGSNIGDRFAHLEKAFAALSTLERTSLSSTSPIYETAPWGDTDQNSFLNACAIIQTQLAPQDLLARLKDIEEDLGRTTTRRWGPRVIDIDILIYDDLELQTNTLTIPHVNLVNRVFVLVPLLDIWPDLVVHGEPIETHLNRLPREGGDIFVYEPMPKG